MASSFPSAKTGVLLQTSLRHQHGELSLFALVFQECRVECMHTAELQVGTAEVFQRRCQEPASLCEGTRRDAGLRHPGPDLPYATLGSYSRKLS